MTSNKDNAADTPQKSIQFKFGEYVTPNPKPISIGLQLNVDPKVQYEKIENVETECKKKQKSQRNNQENERNESKPKMRVNVIKPTPLKEKVKKQQYQLETLQAQIEALKLENEKLRRESESNSNSTSPKMVKKHIEFSTSVNVMGADDTKKDGKLNENPSEMRSNRNATPYKPKSKKNVHDKENVPAKNNLVGPQDFSSRCNYRITPIPVRSKGAKFKKKLKNIRFNIDNIDNNNDREKVNNDKDEDNDNQQSKSNSTSGFLTALKSKSNNINKSNHLCPSGTPSFIANSNTNNNGAGSSNFVTPILTPVKGMKMKNRNPFTFSWNQEDNE